MDKPEMYSKTTLFTKREAVNVWNEFSNKMNWNKNGDRIIDLGCADGGVTNVTKKYLPNNFLKLVGCDINEKMVKYANEHNGDERTSFEQLNLEIQLPNEYKGQYDHVISFFLIHLVQNQSRLFQNYYDLLDENGQCLFTRVTNIPVYDAYRAMSRTEKWGIYLTDVEKKISPYQDCQDPVTVVTKLMEEAGFKNVDVSCRDRTHIFDTLQDLKDFLRAINMFKVPEEKLDDYFEDMIEIIFKNKMMSWQMSRKFDMTSVQMKYKFIVGFGCK